MLDNFYILIAIGALLGFLSGLGIGGGSLLILWLTLVVGLEQGTARQINLLFFIPSAVIASLFRWKQGSLHIKSAFPAILAGCISAAAFSYLAQNMDITALKKLFGILLLLTALRELFYNPKKKKGG